MVTGRDGLSPANGDLIVIYVEIPSLVINCILTTAMFGFQGAERAVAADCLVVRKTSIYHNLFNILLED